jgi:hypothetical protein
MKINPASWGRLHGSRLHRPSASSYTSAVPPPSPPATTTHPPTAALARSTKPRFVHRRQWLPLCIVSAQAQHLARRRECSSGKISHSSEDGEAAVAQNTPTASRACHAHARQLPPPPASRIRWKPLSGRQLLQYLRRYALGSCPRKRRVRLATSQPCKSGADEKGEEEAECTPQSPSHPCAPPGL